ncbi:hypothetical protein D9M68_841330 [compost metagenome]
MQRTAEQLPGAAQHQQRDEHRQDRIDRHPAGVPDHHGSNDGGNRAEQIAQHMHHGAADIDVLLVPARQHEEHHDVHHKAQHGDDEHRPSEHFVRREEALDGFVDDPAD